MDLHVGLKVGEEPKEILKFAHFVLISKIFNLLKKLVTTRGKEIDEMGGLRSSAFGIVGMMNDVEIRYVIDLNESIDDALASLPQAQKRLNDFMDTMVTEAFAIRLSYKDSHWVFDLKHHQFELSNSRTYVRT